MKKNLGIVLMVLVAAVCFLAMKDPPLLDGSRTDHIKSESDEPKLLGHAQAKDMEEEKGKKEPPPQRVYPSLRPQEIEKSDRSTIEGQNENKQGTVKAEDSGILILELFSDVRRTTCLNQDYKYNQTSTYWAAVGVRPGGSTTDWDIKLYEETTFDTFLEGSYYGEGDVDFVVRDYNHAPTGWEGVRVQRYSGIRCADVEYEDHTETLQLGSNSYNWPLADVVEIYDIYLSPGTYSFSVSTWGLVDLGIGFFDSYGAPSDYALSRNDMECSSDGAGSGGSESFICTVDHADWYGVILWANNDLGGNFEIYIESLEENIALTSPNGGEYWYVGSEHDITWTSPGYTGNVKIEYSTNGGAIWTTIVDSTDDNTYPWTIPDTSSTTCLVKISDPIDGIPVDTSNSFFTIYKFRIDRDGWGFPSYYLTGPLDVPPDSAFIYMWPHDCWVVYTQYPYNSQFDRLTGPLLRSSDFPSWPLWVAAFGEDQCYLNPPPAMQVVYRPTAVLYWRIAVLGLYPLESDSTNWWGSCFGFAISSYLFFDEYLDTESYFPGYSQLFDVPLGDCGLTSGRQLVNTYMTHFYGWQHLRHIAQSVMKPPSQTLQEIDSMFGPDGRDHQALGLIWRPTHMHFINPVKVETHEDPDSVHIKYIWVYDNIWPGFDRVYCCPGAPEPDTVTDIPIRVRVNTTDDSWSYVFVETSPFTTGKGLFLMEPVSNYLEPPEMFIPEDIGIFVTPSANVSYESTVLGKTSLDSLMFSFSLPLVLEDETHTLEFTDIQDSLFYFHLFTPDSTVFSYTRSDVDSTQQEIIRYLGDGRTVELENPDDTRSYDFEAISAAIDSEIVYSIRDISIGHAERTRYSIVPDTGFRVTNEGGDKTYSLQIEIAGPNGDDIFSHTSIPIGFQERHLIIPDWRQNHDTLTILVGLLGGPYDDTLEVVNQAGAAFFIRGDCTGTTIGYGDGTMAMSDAIYILKVLYVPGTPAPMCDDALDANDSGDWAMSDAIYVLKALYVPGEPPPPTPFPDCGVDPTADELSCEEHPCMGGRQAVRKRIGSVR